MQLYYSNEVILHLYGRIIALKLHVCFIQFFIGTLPPYAIPDKQLTVFIHLSGLTCLNTLKAEALNLILQ